MNRRVKICMVGAGRVGKNHSTAITQHIPGAKIVALVDPAEKILEETAAQFNIDHTFKSLEDAIDKVDFVKPQKRTM